MSRRQPQLYPESHLPPGELEEEQIISGAGEGDETMEDAHGEEEEGYSELCSCSVRRRTPLSPALNTMRHGHRATDLCDWNITELSSYVRLLHTDLYFDMDQLVLLTSWA